MIFKSNMFNKKISFLLKKSFSSNFLNNKGSFGVIGAGQMGTGIAYVFSRYLNKEIIVYDVNEKQLKGSEKFLNNLYEKEVNKGKISAEDKSKCVNLLKFTTNLNDFKESLFTVEAVSENFNIKKDIFKQLDQITPSNAILASNTSSISITKLAALTSRPHQVIGMHFMNPVPVMKLVEIIKGLQTDQNTLTTTLEIVKVIQKEHTESKDIPGFIANRILMPYINEAIFALYEGIGSVEDIDKTMKLGTNVPMGPLTLADFIGLDTVLYILNVLYDELKDPKYRACPLLVNYVNAGWMGKKSGRGFYKYANKI